MKKSLITIAVISAMLTSCSVKWTETSEGDTHTARSFRYPIDEYLTEMGFTCQYNDNNGRLFFLDLRYAIQQTAALLQLGLAPKEFRTKPKPDGSAQYLEIALDGGARMAYSGEMHQGFIYISPKDTNNLVKQINGSNLLEIYLPMPKFDPRTDEFYKQEFILENAKESIAKARENCSNN